MESGTDFLRRISPRRRRMITATGKTLDRQCGKWAKSGEDNHLRQKK